MKVYRVASDTELFNVLPSEQEDLEDLIATTRGEFHWPESRELTTRILGSMAVDRIIYTDFPYLGSLYPLCMSPFAEQNLSHIMANSGYFVKTDLKRPIDDNRHCYKLFFFTKMLDVLDMDKSVYKTFSSGRIMSISLHALIEEQISPCSIFKIKNAPRTSTFATESFRKLVEDLELTGLLFSPVWSSETGPFDTKLFSPYLPGGGDRKKANRLIAAKRERARKIVAARPPM